MSPATERTTFDEAVIEDVATQAWKQFWEQHTRLVVICVAISASIFALSVLLIQTSLRTGRGFSTDILVIAVLPLVWPLIKYDYIVRDLREVFLRQLAAAIGFDYTIAADMHITNAQTFATGEQHYLHDMLKGTYRGYPMRIYKHVYTTKQFFGRRKVRREETICELLFADSLPHILLNFKTKAGGMERVRLEGTFTDHITVHASAGHQIEVRQIFEPDAMHEALQNFKNIRVEFMPEPSGTRVYFVYDGLIHNRAKFLALIHSVNALLDKVLPGMGSVHRQKRSEA